LDKVPKDIAESLQYKDSRPEEVVKTCITLRLDLNYEFDLIWIARLALVLPIPPLWTCQKENTYEDVDINISYHSDESETTQYNKL
jgi:hypothetical protein